mgnify:CR=1 FL=1
MLKPHKKTANVMYEREESVFDRVPNIMPALNNENTPVSYTHLTLPTIA